MMSYLYFAPVFRPPDEFHHHFKKKPGGNIEPGVILSGPLFWKYFSCTVAGGWLGGGMMPKYKVIIGPDILQVDTTDLTRIWWSCPSWGEECGSLQVEQPWGEQSTLVWTTCGDCENTLQSWQTMAAHVSGDHKGMLEQSRPGQGCIPDLVWRPTHTV